jgi:[acyl-carrier-protein] S-malonyltransferase
MAPAAEGLSRALRQTPIRDADIPVVTNVNARPARAADELRQALVEQLTARVRWAETMRWFLDSGFDRFVETGPGKVLQGMARQIDRRAEVVGVSSPETIASLRAAASSRAEPLPKAAES